MVLLPFNSLQNHCNEFLIIVKRSKVLIRAKIRMTLHILFKLDNTHLIWFILGQKFINLFELLILLNLRFWSGLLWLLYIQGIEITWDELIWKFRLHHGFLIYMPNITTHLVAQLDQNGFYSDCCSILVGNLLSTLGRVQFL